VHRRCWRAEQAHGSSCIRARVFVHVCQRFSKLNQTLGGDLDRLKSVAMRPIYAAVWICWCVVCLQ